MGSLDGKGIICLCRPSVADLQGPQSVVQAEFPFD